MMICGSVIVNVEVEFTRAPVTDDLVARPRHAFHARVIRAARAVDSGD